MSFPRHFLSQGVSRYSWMSGGPKLTNERVEGMRKVRSDLLKAGEDARGTEKRSEARHEKVPHGRPSPKQWWTHTKIRWYALPSPHFESMGISN